MLPALLAGITAIVLSIIGDFGGGAGGSPPKDKGWLNRLADALKRLAGSVVGAILSLLGKTIGFVAEHI